MASVTAEGFDEIGKMLQELGDIPFEVITEALDDMAAVAETKLRATGESMGIRDPESQVHILDRITHTKPKQTDSGGRCAVTFSGTRTRGRTKTRNAEIAFVNEYGKRGQTPRPFIRVTAEASADAIAAPGEKVIGAYWDKTVKG